MNQLERTLEKFHGNDLKNPIDCSRNQYMDLFSKDSKIEKIFSGSEVKKLTSLVSLLMNEFLDVEY